MPVFCGDGEYTTVNAKGGADSAVEGTIALLPERAADTWRREPRALLVGDQVAQMCGWKVGQTVTVRGLTSNISSGDSSWEFLIAGIFHNNEDPRKNHLVLAHYDYVDASRTSRKGTVFWFSEQVATDADINQVANRIDQRFAHSYPSTHTVANVGAQAVLAQFGDVHSVIIWILTAVFFCMLLVTVNVAAHAVAERRGSLALLNALGFRPWQMVWAFLAETFFLIGIGTAVGIGMGIWTTHLVEPIVSTVLDRFTVSWGAIGWAAALSCGFIVITAIPPIVQIVRLKPVGLLRA